MSDRFAGWDCKLAASCKHDGETCKLAPERERPFGLPIRKIRVVTDKGNVAHWFYGISRAGDVECNSFEEDTRRNPVDR